MKIEDVEMRMDIRAVRNKQLWVLPRLVLTAGMFGDRNPFGLSLCSPAGVWSLVLSPGVPVNPAFCCLPED